MDKAIIITKYVKQDPPVESVEATSIPKRGGEVSIRRSSEGRVMFETRSKGSSRGTGNWASFTVREAKEFLEKALRMVEQMDDEG